MSAGQVLAIVALILALTSLFPPASSYPLLVVSVILLAVAFLLPMFVH